MKKLIVVLVVVGVAVLAITAASIFLSATNEERCFDGAKTRLNSGSGDGSGSKWNAPSGSSAVKPDPSNIGAAALSPLADGSGTKTTTKTEGSDKKTNSLPGASSRKAPPDGSSSK